MNIVHISVNTRLNILINFTNIVLIHLFDFFNSKDATFEEIEIINCTVSNYRHSIQPVSQHEIYTSNLVKIVSEKVFGHSNSS